MSDPQFMTTGATLGKCIWHIQTKTPGCYVRFGDGDFFILQGKEEQLCKPTPEFQADLLKSIQCIDDSTMFACCFHNRELNMLEPGMEPYIFESELSDLQNFFHQLHEYNPNIKTIYSAIALHYAMCFKPAAFSKVLQTIRENGSTILMHNEEFDKKRLQAFFGPCKHICAAREESYQDKEVILSQFKVAIQKVDGFCVCILALGCGGRAMLPDMRKLIQQYNKQVFIFDFGSPIDLLMELETRHWIALVPQLGQHLLQFEKEVGIERQD
jgi:hypothetical protein